MHSKDLFTVDRTTVTKKAFGQDIFNFIRACTVYITRIAWGVGWVGCYLPAVFGGTIDNTPQPAGVGDTRSTWTPFTLNLPSHSFCPEANHLAVS